MATLWQFFGFPDPEGNTNKMPQAPQESVIEAESVESEVASLDEITDAPHLGTSAIPRGWTGPLTPDGEPFHDMDAYTPQSIGAKIRTALRYVRPDSMHRLPIQGMHQRIQQGDTLIVDLRPLIHMDAHKDACRRQLRHLGDESGVSVFALDLENQLLLIPGVDVVVDVSKHELGLIPVLL